MQAAVGCAQIKKLPDFIEKRRKNFERLKNGLKELEDKIILPEPEKNSLPSWFGFLITCKEGVDRNKVTSYLENHGIQTRNLFAGNIIKHPCFDEIRNDEKSYRVVGNLENTNRVMQDTFWIGVYPGMINEQIDYMIKVIKQIVC